MGGRGGILLARVWMTGIVAIRQLGGGVSDFPTADEPTDRIEGKKSL